MPNVITRILQNLIGRIGGSLSFRLIIQPLVTGWFALRAGWNDAQQGRAPYGWEFISNPIKRRDLLRECWKDIAKIFVTAIIIDLVYQIIELRWLHPAEALIVATVLVLLPYKLLRGLANRVLRRPPKSRELR